MSGSIWDNDGWDLVLAEQVRTNGRLFFQLAYHILEDPTASEDACQQAFLKAAAYRDSLRDSRALKAWLARVVTNEAMQIVRRRKTERKALGEHSKNLPSPEGAQEQAERRLAVEEALAEVPEPFRTAVVMRTLWGMSVRETAAELGCAESEVSRRYYLGLERLRPHFSRERKADHAV